MLPEVVLPVGKRTALSPPVLVAGDTIHGVFPAIEIEPLTWPRSHNDADPTAEPPRRPCGHPDKDTKLLYTDKDRYGLATDAAWRSGEIAVDIHLDTRSHPFETEIHSLIKHCKTIRSMRAASTKPHKIMDYNSPRHYHTIFSPYAVANGKRHLALSHGAVTSHRTTPLCRDSTSSGKGVIRLLDQSKHPMIKFITNVVMVNW